MLPDIVDRYDVGMRQHANNSRLTQKALAELFIRRELRCDDLERHGALEAALNGQIHPSHTPFTKQVFDGVPGNFR